MVEQTQTRKIKCPHCGWIRSIKIPIKEMESHPTRNLTKELWNMVERIKAALADSKLDDANAWIDMPACPNCAKTYRYNVKTGEVTP